MKLKNIGAALLVPLNVLLLFFLIVEDRLVIPAWLQVFGRLHPLVLHFPIVLILIYAAIVIAAPASLKNEAWYPVILHGLLLFAAVTAAFTALMGLVLSKEPGYDAGAIALHKYLGSLTSFALFALYSFRHTLNGKAVLLKTLTGAAAALLLAAGHWGGNITHGNNFVLAPVTPEHKKPPVAFEDAYVYSDLVEPIIETKCLQCHNSSKAKGELVMETKELLMKGGKDGKLWDTTQVDLGLMMKRIHLPQEEKEHMPPDGKPQLTDEEMAILFAWIKEGANFDTKVAELPPQDTLRILAAKKLQQSLEEQFEFAAANEKQVQSLNNNNRVIAPIAVGSPALNVTFYNRPFFNTKALEELKPIANNITELNLDNMPVKDADLAIIGTFKNLRKLVLNNTDITGNTLAQLQGLANVKTLSLSGTAVKTPQLGVLLKLAKLKHVYLWNTAVNDAGLKTLAGKNTGIAWFTGFKGDTVILKLTPPVMQNDQFVITNPEKLKLKYYIKGTNIRYTTNGKDPDSLTSPLYDTNVVIASEMTVKAKAFKPGWISSDIIQQHFYKTTFVPDSAALLTPQDAKYKANGAKSLIDLDKSDLNFASGKWVGYRQNDMTAMLFFNKPVTAKSITFSMLLNIGAFIFPPARIDVWGGMDKNHLALLGSVTPQQPTKDMIAGQNIAEQCNFNPTQVKYIKFSAAPVHSLPAWHQGKGQKAWVFMDEVFVN